MIVIVIVIVIVKHICDNDDNNSNNSNIRQSYFADWPRWLIERWTIEATVELAQEPEADFLECLYLETTKPTQATPQIPLICVSFPGCDVTTVAGQPNDSLYTLMPVRHLACRYAHLPIEIQWSPTHAYHICASGRVMEVQMLRKRKVRTANWRTEVRWSPALNVKRLVVTRWDVIWSDMTMAITSNCLMWMIALHSKLIACVTLAMRLYYIISATVSRLILQ